MVAMIAKNAIASRSREGAWIEMPLTVFTSVSVTVAPVRERGLKSCVNR